MDDFETPYEDDTEIKFIDCDICSKSIRGDTLYKIHLTTHGHIKKEDVLVTQGKAVRQNTVPDFKDILQYLDYLKLEEPVIGLSYLQEVPNFSPELGPKYTCKLCNATSTLPDTVHHVIGRKHRQKYLELKRPDLVTWAKQSMTTQSGKLIRARAEIIERQDGSGTPMPLKNNRIGDKSNISRVRPWQNRDMNIHPTHRDEPPPEHRRFNHGRGRRFHNFSNPPPGHPEDHYMWNPDMDGPSHDQREEGYWEDHMYREPYMDFPHRREYEGGYPEDLPRGQMHDGFSRFGSQEQMQYGHPPGEEYYPQGPREYYPETGQLEDVYTQEDERRQTEYQSPQDPYPKDAPLQWPPDREFDRRPRSSEPEADKMRFLTPSDSDCSHHQIVNVIKSYRQEMLKPRHEETTPGPSRVSPSRPADINRMVSNIPEPFMRFLKGGASGEELGKRKRKSRFSDATTEEMRTVQETLCDEFGPPKPKFGNRPTSASSVLGSEIHGRPNPEHYPDSQSPRHVENYPREFMAEHSGGTESVFDMLTNIEIENVQEADFLKNKLWNILKEFNSKKQEKTMQNTPGRAVFPNDYNTSRSDSQPSGYDHYDGAVREDTDIRRPKDLYLREDHRIRDQMHPEHVTDERLHYPERDERRRSNRSPYKEKYDWDEMAPTRHPNESTHYPEMYQAPLPSHDYKPAGEEFFQSRRSRSPEHMARGPRMHRGPEYKSSLDKITSTLLELVSRK